MKANSDTKPENIIKCKEKSIVNYNIKEIEITDPETGETKKVWEYDYVEIKGEVTKAKFKDAIEKSDKEGKDETSWTLNEVISEFDQLKITGIEVSTILESLTYDQVDNYINNNVTNLASAREYLKKLSKIVLYLERR